MAELDQASSVRHSGTTPQDSHRRGRPFRLLHGTVYFEGAENSRVVMARLIIFSLSLQAVEPTTIDIFEKYPVPFGLARFGVAPDHPEASADNPHDPRRPVSTAFRQRLSSPLPLRLGEKLHRSI